MLVFASALSMRRLCIPLAFRPRPRSLLTEVAVGCEGVSEQVELDFAPDVGQSDAFRSLCETMATACLS